MSAKSIDRLKAINRQLHVEVSNKSRRNVSVEDPDDVVIVNAKRTAICKAKRGSFKDTPSCDMLAAVLAHVVEDVNLDKRLVNDICVGNVLQPSSGAIRARMAQFYAGFPETTCLSVCNRQCSSGLQAVMNIAAAIKTGSCNIGIGAGFESMSLYKMGTEIDANNINPKMMENNLAMECTVPMGVTSENVAERYGISREKQDQLAIQSHKRAALARKEGRFKNEIVSVTTEIEDKEGNRKTVTVSEDDGIRPDVSMESLKKLRAVFKEDGTTTAGNSSQVSDGAAAVLLMKRKTAKQMNLPVLGIIRAYQVVGVKPDEMGIGPALAIPEALNQAGLTVADIDIFEINEAFASQATYCIEKLGIPIDKVNPNGGAIALGHPLGCTGARQIVTLLHEMKRRGSRGYGIVSMCIGSGMGAAAVIEYEG